LTRQAIQLGYCPRLNIEHTSATEHGQIYIPQVNWALMVATIGLVIGFRTSDGLAAAYGIAVTSTMLITTMLAYLVARERWGVSRTLAGSLAAFFLTIEFGFFGANLIKIAHGGWFPLVVGALVFIALSTWKQGRALLGSRLAEKDVSVRSLPQGHCRPAAVSRARHRDLHDEQSARHAPNAPAQSRTQSRAARTRHPADGGYQ
jgi:KUP system potassium uptake protein